MALDRLRTARLDLRPLTADDGPALLTALGDLAVTRWLRRVPHPYGPDDFARFLPLARAGACWAVHDGSGLAGVIDMNDELGYWLARTHWGRGYATEAARAVLGAHFTDPEAVSVRSGYFIGNNASARVLEKLGFRPTHRVTVHPLSRPGEAVESQRMILTAADWDAAQG